MNIRLRHHLWLLSGITLAGLLLLRTWPTVSIVDAGWVVAAVACGLALHFRAHAHRLAVYLTDERERREATARRLRVLAEDLDRTQSVLDDNLEELLANPTAPTASLYAGGSRAHTQRLRDMVMRLRQAASPGEDERP